MFEEWIDESFIVMQGGTSEGTQIKYQKDGFWYKKDNRGREGLAEYLSSKLLKFSSLEPGEYVEYEQGTINNRPGCRSRNFLKPEEELITFYRLYYNVMGKNLAQVISGMDSMEERIDYVVDFILHSCGLDVKPYLSKILTLDMLVLNEDRHLNNLAVILKENQFEAAPIFDNGVSLLTANQSTSRHLSLPENVERVVARPFSGSHKKMVEYLEPGFSLDCEAALFWLFSEPVSMERDVLIYQIKKYQEIL